MIHRVHISDEQKKRVAALSRRYCLGGGSAIDKKRSDQTRYRQQYVGIVGELAYHIYQFGDDERYFAHKGESLTMRNDGGQDVHGMNIDIKTSAHNPPFDYLHLWVRPEEYKPEWVYVQAFAVNEGGRPVVYLTGYANSSDLEPDADGRYTSLVRDLRPLMPHVWTVNGESVCEVVQAASVLEGVAA